MIEESEMKIFRIRYFVIWWTIYFKLIYTLVIEVIYAIFDRFRLEFKICLKQREYRQGIYFLVFTWWDGFMDTYGYNLQANTVTQI